MIIYYAFIDVDALMYGFSEIDKVSEILNRSTKTKNFIEENQIDLNKNCIVEDYYSVLFFIKNIRTKSDLYHIDEFYLSFAYWDTDKGKKDLDISERSRQYLIDTIWDYYLSYQRNKKITKLLTDIKNKCRVEK